MTPGEAAGAPAIEVVVTPYGMSHLELGPRAVVVIDVLRACTTIAHALDAGARGVVPAETVEDAMRLAQTLGRDSTVLGGERGGERIDGFERGNSPREYGPDVVAGRTIVLTTSNGARALAAASEARACLAATFVNLSAAAQRLAEHELVTIVCARAPARVSRWRTSSARGGSPASSAGSIRIDGRTTGPGRRKRRPVGTARICRDSSVRRITAAASSRWDSNRISIWRPKWTGSGPFRSSGTAVSRLSPPRRIAPAR